MLRSRCTSRDGEHRLERKIESNDSIQIQLASHFDGPAVWSLYITMASECVGCVNSVKLKWSAWSHQNQSFSGWEGWVVVCQEAEAKQWSVDVPILQLKNKNKMDRFGTIKTQNDQSRSRSLSQAMPNETCVKLHDSGQNRLRPHWTPDVSPNSIPVASFPQSFAAPTMFNACNVLMTKTGIIGLGMASVYFCLLLSTSVFHRSCQGCWIFSVATRSLETLDSSPPCNSSYHQNIMT